MRNWKRSSVTKSPSSAPNLKRRRKRCDKATRNESHAKPPSPPSFAPLRLGVMKQSCLRSRQRRPRQLCDARHAGASLSQGLSRLHSPGSRLGRSRTSPTPPFPPHADGPLSTLHASRSYDSFPSDSGRLLRPLEHDRPQSARRRYSRMKRSIFPVATCCCSRKPAVFCAQHRIGTIAIGSLGHNPFPDATPKFLSHFSQAVGEALNFKCRIIAPFRKLTKEQVIRRGVRMNAAAALEFLLHFSKTRSALWSVQQVRRTSARVSRRRC